MHELSLIQAKVIVEPHRHNEVYTAKDKEDVLAKNDN